MKHCDTLAHGKKHPLADSRSILAAAAFFATNLGAHLVMVLTIRAATEHDAVDLFNWRNDKTTRAMSRDSEPLAWDLHRAWFINALESDQRDILICEESDSNAKVGMVRFDVVVENFSAEISINLAPTMRGRGYAPICLVNAIEHYKKLRPIYQVVLAEIKKDNLGSRKSFERAGFQLTDEQGSSWHYDYQIHRQA